MKGKNYTKMNKRERKKPEILYYVSVAIRCIKNSKIDKSNAHDTAARKKHHVEAPASWHIQFATDRFNISCHSIFFLRRIYYACAFSAICNLPNKQNLFYFSLFFNSYFSMNERKKWFLRFYINYTPPSLSLLRSLFLPSVSLSVYYIALNVWLFHKNTKRHKNIRLRKKKNIKFTFNKGYKMNLTSCLHSCEKRIIGQGYNFCKQCQLISSKLHSNIAFYDKILV